VVYMVIDWMFVAWIREIAEFQVCNLVVSQEQRVNDPDVSMLLVV